jgi:hypothetical protein
MFALLIAALVAGCASTKLVDVWRDEAYAGQPLTKVLVVSIAEEERSRRIFEDSFAREFRAQGIEAVAGYTLISAAAATERAAISQAIEGKGFDGVVISHHSGSNEETVYYPGRTRTETWGTGRGSKRHGYDGYYHRTWETVSEPGYTARYTTIFIETNIYETENQQLIWSGRSASYDPGSVLEIIHALSKDVIASMKEGGLL